MLHFAVVHLSIKGIDNCCQEPRPFENHLTHRQLNSNTLFQNIDFQYSFRNEEEPPGYSLLVPNGNNGQICSFSFLSMKYDSAATRIQMQKIVVRFCSAWLCFGM